MSILIKDLPLAGYEISIMRDGDKWRARVDGIWCDVEEIPTPHGRLGDLDELEKQFKRAIGTYLPKDPTRHMSIVEASRCRGWTQGLMAVQEAETVIKGED